MRDVIVVLLFSFFFTGLFLLSYTRRYNEAKKRTFRSLLKIDLIELDNFRDKIFLRDISLRKLYNTVQSVISSDFCHLNFVIELCRKVYETVPCEMFRKRDTIEDTKGALQPLLTNVN